MVSSSKNLEKLHAMLLSVMHFLAVSTGLLHLVQDDILLKLAGVVFLTLAFLAMWPTLQREDLQVIATQILVAFAAATLFLYFFIQGIQGTESAVGMVAKVFEGFICLTYLGIKIIAVRKKKAAVVYAAIPRYSRPAEVAKRLQ